MTDITEMETEAVARAICAAHGFDPDEIVLDENCWNIHRWMKLRQTALTQIAAYRAIRAMEK